jgi:hypothetical protein
MPIILSSPHTSGMDFLTSSRIYCLYPTLLQRGENIIVSRSNLFYEGPDTGFLPFNFGLRSYASTRDWVSQRRPCGAQCPALWREMKSLRYTRVMRWGGVRGDLDTGSSVSPSDGFEHSPFIWKMEGICQNRYCPNINRGDVAE